MTKDVSAESEVRVLKSATSPSVSGKSKLTYEIGLKNESDPVIRIAKNSGGGFFSDEWLPLAAIQKVLAGRGAEKGLTSNAFRGTYQGKSVNTAGFLVAVLKAACTRACARSASVPPTGSASMVGKPIKHREVGSARITGKGADRAGQGWVQEAHRFSILWHRVSESGGR